MLIRRLSLFLSLILLPISSLLAVEFSGLYEAEITVANTSPETRKGATLQALNEVFVKLTGQSNISNNPALKETLEKADRFVQSYRYKQSNDPNEPSQIITSLWVQFDQRAIDLALKESGVPIWSTERPLVIIWLAIQDGKKRYLVPEGIKTGYDKLLLDAAQKRGLPIIFPLLDLQERNLISFSDVWAGFQDIILAASARYKPDTVLIGKVKYLSNDLARAEWTLLADNSAWTVNPTPSEALLSAGIHETADRLSRLYTAQDVDSQTVLIDFQVSGINSLEQVKQVETYLNDLNPIKNSSLHQLTSNSVFFQISVAGNNLEKLKSLIALSKMLTPVTTPTTETAPPEQPITENSNQLHYVFKP